MQTPTCKHTHTLLVGTHHGLHEKMNDFHLAHVSGDNPSMYMNACKVNL